MNHYYCSDGTRVTQSQIDRRLSETKRKMTIISLDHLCHGCHNQAEAFAHIIPKARCKVLHKTELIWTGKNMFPACHNCNSIAENVSSAAIRKLKNFEYIKEYLRLHDIERYNKLTIHEKIT